jgi:hypothetical protein
MVSSPIGRDYITPVELGRTPLCKLSATEPAEEIRRPQQAKYSPSLMFEQVWRREPRGRLPKLLHFSKHRRAEFPSPWEDVLK